MARTCPKFVTGSGATSNEGTRANRYRNDAGPPSSMCTTAQTVAPGAIRLRLGCSLDLRRFHRAAQVGVAMLKVVKSANVITGKGNNHGSFTSTCCDANFAETRGGERHPIHLPDASGGAQTTARQLPQVRHDLGASGLNDPATAVAESAR